eukprot:1253511-Heterocapsa_arctica.AAC.1
MRDKGGTWQGVRAGAAMPWKMRAAGAELHGQLPEATEHEGPAGRLRRGWGGRRVRPGPTVSTPTGEAAAVWTQLC